MDKNYGGVIWTTHAIDRLRERGISQGDAWVTWRRPDQSRPSQYKNTWIYYRDFSDQRVEVVAKKNTENEWLILSVWSRKTRHKQEENTFWKFLTGIFGKNKR